MSTALALLASLLIGAPQAATCLDGCELLEDLFVCSDREVIDRLDDLRSDGDTEAFKEYATAAFLSTGKAAPPGRRELRFSRTGKAYSSPPTSQRSASAAPQLGGGHFRT